MSAHHTKISRSSFKLPGLKIHKMSSRDVLDRWKHVPPLATRPRSCTDEMWKGKQVEDVYSIITLRGGRGKSLPSSAFT